VSGTYRTGLRPTERIASSTPEEAVMNDQLTRADEVFSTLSTQEKRRHLTLLSESIWHRR
jgi:hypothetical protein